MEPKPGISKEARQRAQRTIERYGLDRPELKGAYQRYLQTVFHDDHPADVIAQTLDKVYLHPDKLQALAQPEKDYSLMAKCLLEYYDALA